MKEQIKDIAIRALKTFWQAALAFAIINSEILFTDITAFDGEKLKQLGLTVHWLQVYLLCIMVFFARLFHI